MIPIRRGANGLPFFSPEEWDDPTDPIYFNGLPTVEIQIIGAPTAPYTVQRSFNGVTYVDANAYDKDGNVVTAITAAGIYSLDGGCYVKLVGGSGSTVYFRGGA